VLVRQRERLGVEVVEFALAYIRAAGVARHPHRPLGRDDGGGNAGLPGSWGCVSDEAEERQPNQGDGDAAKLKQGHVRDWQTLTPLGSAQFK